MKAIRRISIAVLLTIFILPTVSAAEIYMQARIFFDSPTQIDQLKSMHLDRIWQGIDYIEIITDKVELAELEGLGFKTEIVHEDLTAFYKSRFDKVTGYLSLTQIELEMIYLQIWYPEIVGNRVSIGQTIEGRDIWALKVSDNPEIDEDEPEILFTSAVHPREGVTPLILLNFIEHLGENYGINPEITDLVDNREIWIVLAANPDGYAFNDEDSPEGGGLWRKNRRDNGDGTFGVDLNRNFSYMWGYDDVGSSPYTFDSDYRGTAPFSEPETQAIRDFTIAHNFLIVVNFHSCWDMVFYAWTHAPDLYTPDNNYFAALGCAIYELNGYEYAPGWFLWPYNGSSDDWNYGEQTLKDKCFGLTIETGNSTDGYWPSTARILPIVQENLLACLYLTWAVGNIDAVFKPENPALTAPDSVGIDMPFILEWSHDDTLNPAVEYELVEMTGRSRVFDDLTSTDNWDNNGFYLSDSSYSPPSSFYSGYPPHTAPRHFQTKHPYHVNPGDTLKFQTRYMIPPYHEFAYAEVSADGINFNPIPGNITTDSTPFGGKGWGNGITGLTLGDWLEGLFDLSDFVGDDIYFRFSYRDHDSLSFPFLRKGIYIDNICPVMRFETSDVIVSGFTNTSFTIPGKPEDVYYYKVRAKDAEGQLSGYSDYVRVVVGNPQEYICGDVNGDGLLDVSDAGYLLQHILCGGTEPSYYGQSEVDDCENINISDVAYLLSYLYYGGPAPCEGSVTCDLPSEGNWISLGCPIRKPTSPEDDSLAVPVYMTSNTELLAFTIGFECDTAFKILSFDAAGTELSDPSMIKSIIFPSENQILLAYYETPGIISPQTEALIGSIWIRIPAGTEPQTVDFDSASIGQTGEFIFSPTGGGTIHPAYVDCGTEDIVILPEYACGDADGNMEINILDITYLISHLYKGGPSPEPPEAGDANADGLINILDITYLINFLYKGGPAPVCP